MRVLTAALLPAFQSTPTLTHPTHPFIHTHPAAQIVVLVSVAAIIAGVGWYQAHSAGAACEEGLGECHAKVNKTEAALNYTKGTLNATCVELNASTILLKDTSNQLRTSSDVLKSAAAKVRAPPSFRVFPDAA